MATVTQYRWRYFSRVHGKWITTRHHMTAEDAKGWAAGIELGGPVDIQPVESTRSELELVEPEDFRKHSTSAPFEVDRHKKQD